MMPWMSQELEGFVEKDHIFALGEAWFRYPELAQESGHDISQSLKSQKVFFEKKNCPS